MPPRTFQSLKTRISREFSGRYRIIYLIAALEALLCFLPGMGWEGLDTGSYIEVWRFYDISRLETFVDMFRTPVYPLFIGIATLDERLPLTSLLFAQWLVFIATIPYFRRLASEIVRHQGITFWMTAFYAVYWGVIEVNYYAMSESLSQSFLVFFTYFAVLGIRRGGMRRMCLGAFWLLMLVFLRPAFCYLPLVYAAVCIYMALRRCREGVLGLALTVLVAMAMSGYACVFDRKYGYFAMSDVSTYNNYIRCLYSGILDEQFYLPEMRPYMKKPDPVTGKPTWTESIPSHMNHSTEFHHCVTANIDAHKYEFLKATVYTFPSFWRCRANQCASLYWPVGMMLTLGMDTAAVLVMIYISVAATAMFRHKMLMPVPLLIAGIWITHAMVTWLGAYWAFDRLIQPVFPMLILVFGHLCSFSPKPAPPAMYSVADDLRPPPTCTCYGCDLINASISNYDRQIDPYSIFFINFAEWKTRPISI